MKIIPQQPPQSQSGMVSIIVTLVLMLVISMIVIGFAQISRREQRQSLDRQLSTQAFLAAESGVNDVQKIIRDSLSSGASVPEKDNCAPGAATPVNPYGYLNPDLDAGDVSYTCLLVTTKLSNIKQEVGTGNSAVVIPLHPATGSGQITTLHIKWNAPNATSTAGCATSTPSIGSFPKVSGWASCPFGVLRVDMVPTGPGAAFLNRNALINNQKAFYLYPLARPPASPTPTLNYANAKGAVAAMSCAANVGCRADITNINSAGSTDYSLRLTAIYTPGVVDISADATLGPTIALEDAQAQVDVTGRAQDVLRRIQVRLPISLIGNTPGYAVQSGSSICKRFGVAPGRFEVAADIIGAGQDSNNPLCVP